MASQVRSVGPLDSAGRPCHSVQRGREAPRASQYSIGGNVIEQSGIPPWLLERVDTFMARRR